MSAPTRKQERYIKDLAAKLDDSRNLNTIAVEMIGEDGYEIRRDKQAASKFIDALLEVVGDE